MSNYATLETQLGTSFIFLLRENWEILKQHGITGYFLKSDPANLVIGSEVFIAVSQRGIYGPFIITGPLTEKVSEVYFSRINYGGNPGLELYDVYQAKAPCTIALTAAPDANLINPLPFGSLEAILEDQRVWRGIWTISLAPKQREIIKFHLAKLKENQPA